MKIRTIITQDAEVDDQNSLRHFLLYSNEVELLGIMQTSSKYHRKGIPGAELSFRVYPEVSAVWASGLPLASALSACIVTIPQEAAAGDVLHIIVRARNTTGHRLAHYAQVIITVKA